MPIKGFKKSRATTVPETVRGAAIDTEGWTKEGIIAELIKRDRRSPLLNTKFYMKFSLEDLVKHYNIKYKNDNRKTN